MAKFVDIVRFELVTAPSGNVLVTYVGNTRIDEGSEAWLEEDVLVVGRGDLPALRFVGLLPDDAAALRKAGAIVVNRTHMDGTHETRGVRLRKA